MGGWFHQALPYLVVCAVPFLSSILVLDFFLEGRRIRDRIATLLAVSSGGKHAQGCDHVISTGLMATSGRLCAHGGLAGCQRAPRGSVVQRVYRRLQARHTGHQRLQSRNPRSRSETYQTETNLHVIAEMVVNKMHIKLVWPVAWDTALQTIQLFESPMLATAAR